MSDDCICEQNCFQYKFHLYRDDGTEPDPTEQCVLAGTDEDAWLQIATSAYCQFKGIKRISCKGRRKVTVTVHKRKKK